MGSIYLPIADILSDAGLVVRVTATNEGWETRSRSSGGFSATPLGVMWHHAASSPSTSDESCVNYQVRGNPDAPVGNFTLGRNGEAWPVAGGASNCSGKGGPWQMSRGTVPLDQGNTTLVNVEVNNSGVGEPWSSALIDAYFAATIAINTYCDNEVDDVVGHHHYTPTRKIDPATAGAVQGPWKPRSLNSSGTWNLDDMLAELRARATPAPTPSPEEEPVIIYALAQYTNTWSQQGICLSPEAFNELVAQGAVVVTSEFHGQHIKSLMAVSGLTDADLDPR